MRAAAAMALAAAGGAPVAAQALPTWSIAEICAKEPQQCAAFEARAREAVSGGWGVLPEAYRMACLGEVKLPEDRSWRLLSQCLEQQALKGLDKDAIATAATPAEPVPAPKVDGVPPPPFGIPGAPSLN
jgi:hypothetical protein